MKYKILTLLLAMAITYPAHAEENQKSGWFFGFFPPLEWPKRHWQAQDFKPDIQPGEAVLRNSVDKSKSMFANVDGLKPEDFINNLKNADIIERVYNRTGGVFNQTPTDDIIIELDQNFYTLSYADQTVIAELLAKSYNHDHYLLTDAKTKKTVGQITSDGFLLF